MKAYVLINVRGGKTREVISKVQRIEGIKSANACWGRPDIFAFADVSNDKALANTVLDKILTMDGVEITDTHIVID